MPVVVSCWSGIASAARYSFGTAITCPICQSDLVTDCHLLYPICFSLDRRVSNSSASLSFGTFGQIPMLYCRQACPILWNLSSFSGFLPSVVFSFRKGVSMVRCNYLRWSPGLDSMTTCAAQWSRNAAEAKTASKRVEEVAWAEDMVCSLASLCSATPIMRSHTLWARIFENIRGQYVSSSSTVSADLLSPSYLCQLKPTTFTVPWRSSRCLLMRLRAWIL